MESKSMGSGQSSSVAQQSKRHAFSARMHKIFRFATSMILCLRRDKSATSKPNQSPRMGDVRTRSHHQAQTQLQMGVRQHECRPAPEDELDAGPQIQRSLFLNLPLELRLMIYECVFSDPDHRRFPLIIIGEPLSKRDKRRIKLNWINNLELLLSCRQVYEEAQRLAYRWSTFAIVNPTPQGFLWDLQSNNYFHKSMRGGLPVTETLRVGISDITNLAIAMGNSDFLPHADRRARIRMNPGISALDGLDDLVKDIQFLAFNLTRLARNHLHSLRTFTVQWGEPIYKGAWSPEDVVRLGGHHPLQQLLYGSGAHTWRGLEEMGKVNLTQLTTLQPETVVPEGYTLQTGLVIDSESRIFYGEHPCYHVLVKWKRAQTGETGEVKFHFKEHKPERYFILRR